MTEIPEAVTIREVGSRDGPQLEQPLAFEQKLELIEALAGPGWATLRRRRSYRRARCDHGRRGADSRGPDGLGGRGVAALVASPGGAAGPWRPGSAGSSTSSRPRTGTAWRTCGAAPTKRPRRPSRSPGSWTTGRPVRGHHRHGLGLSLHGVTPPERTVRVAGWAVELGADELCLADTIGATVPGRVLDLVAAVRVALPGTPLARTFKHARHGAGERVGGDHRRGAAARRGGRGLVGCPFAPGATGNIATEELVYLLADSGIETGVDLDRSVDAARLGAAWSATRWTATWSSGRPAAGCPAGRLTRPPVMSGRSRSPRRSRWASRRSMTALVGDQVGRRGAPGRAVQAAEQVLQAVERDLGHAVVAVGSTAEAAQRVVGPVGSRWLWVYRRTRRVCA